MQDGFRLIVAGMTGGDAAGAGLTGHLREEIVAHLASGCFEVRTIRGRGHVDPFNNMRQVGQQFGDESSVGIAIAAAELVVQVRHDKAADRGKLGKPAEQGDAVGAAGNCHDDRAGRIFSEPIQVIMDGGDEFGIRVALTHEQTLN